eukprot:TRINITY_DN2603_c0_g1_i1.p1 TRINITY_DN2603_c0_g1~~TRINITY_DN2603_c0_g1_i1.p1  ORF type:complete len:126 (+),score=11.95 TRINITY_DN2603_c0_g1_i1:329-706(+)
MMGHIARKNGLDAEPSKLFRNTPPLWRAPLPPAAAGPRCSSSPQLVAGCVNLQSLKRRRTRAEVALRYKALLAANFVRTPRRTSAACVRHHVRLLLHFVLLSMGHPLQDPLQVSHDSAHGQTATA